jgi:asparagine synthase (glutamine-hydrolysing)
MEQIYEVRMLEVPTYRPFLEYCLSHPSTIFMRNGQIRWLARELGRGNMPEAQRTSREVGEENGDWHSRLTPRLAEFQETVRQGRLNPELDYFFDFDALDQALDNWPDRPTKAQETFIPLGFGLPRAIAMIRHVNYMTGRNEGA